MARKHSQAQRKLAAADLTRGQVDRITRLGPIRVMPDGGALVTVQVYVPRLMLDKRLGEP